MVKPNFSNKRDNWFSLLTFCLRYLKVQKRKSAIVSILLASLNEVSNGKLLLNQESHFEENNDKGKKMNEKDLKTLLSL